MKLSPYLLLLVLAGCATPRHDYLSPPYGYKYFTLIRDTSGKYHQGPGILEPGETYAFSYAFRRTDLEAISSDHSVAVKKFIEGRRAIPPECTNGINVVSVGFTGNSGVTAHVECK